TQRRLRWREMTPPEFDRLDTRAREELASVGVFSPYEKVFVSSDGSRVPVLVCGVAMQPQYKAHETLCLVQDLSERNRADDHMRSIVAGGRILASSLECDKAFPEFAEFIASRLADSCLIFVEEEGQLIRMAAAHTVPVASDVDLQAVLKRVMA